MNDTKPRFSFETEFARLIPVREQTRSPSPSPEAGATPLTREQCAALWAKHIARVNETIGK